MLERELSITRGGFCLRLAADAQAGPRNGIEALSLNLPPVFFTEAIGALFDSEESGLNLMNEAR